MSTNVSNNKKQNNIVINFNKTTLAQIILCIATLLAFIGIFGAACVVKQTVAQGTNSITTTLGTIDLKFIFKDGWNNLSRIIALKAPADYVAFERFHLVITVVSWSIGLLIFIIAIGMFIYNTINKKQINLNKYFVTIICGLLQYVLLETILANSHINKTEVSGGTVVFTDTNTVLGWGGILIIIALVLGIIGLIINENESPKTFFKQSNLLLKISLVFAFFLGLFGLQAIGRYTYSTESITTNSGVGGSYLLELILPYPTSMRDSIPELAKITGLSIASMTIQLVSLIILISVIYCILRNDLKKNGKYLISASITYTVLIIIAGILEKEALSTAFNNTTIYKLGLGYSSIVGIILGSLLSLSSILSVALIDKNIKFVKGK